MNDSIKIYSDGGARGNPGPAAGGFAIFNSKDKLIKIDAKYFGEITNNQAEYKAFEMALKAAQRLGKKDLECYLDSELIVKQLNGEYKVKSENIKSLKASIDRLAENFDNIEFLHVKREYNKIADKLVNIVLDAREE
jgi:ribonuclease HI